ncbi:MAG TPA: YihY/virulence factor BrkB family protein [Polyangiaceae bacterium]|nr:YihY/virulence factor BrkB family protein [Polyangiaceae bacterium]
MSSERPSGRRSLLVQFARGLEAHDAFNVAASIAYRLFLSLVPLLVIVGYFIGRFARARGVDQVLGPLLDVIPPGAEELVHKELDRMASGGSESLAPLAIAGFLWSASSGCHSLMGALETAVHAKPRPWWKTRAIAIACVMAGLAVACMFVWLVIRVDQQWTSPAVAHPLARTRLSQPSLHRTRRLHLGADAQILVAVLALSLGTTLLAAFYRFAVEHAPRVRRRVWPGAFAAVVAWLFVSWAFGAYAAISIANYTIYYGGLAAVAVLLLWLYLTSFALIFGAEVNAQLEGIRDRPRGPAAVAKRR